MAEDTARAASADPADKGRWRQADVRRAINAAEKAGLRHYRVEIAPDGTIAIVVGVHEDADRGLDQNPA